MPIRSGAFISGASIAVGRRPAHKALVAPEHLSRGNRQDDGDSDQSNHLDYLLGELEGRKLHQAHRPRDQCAVLDPQRERADRGDVAASHLLRRQVRLGKGRHAKIVTPRAEHRLKASDSVHGLHG